MPTIRELTASETYLAYTSLLELRPHLAACNEFVEQVNLKQRPEGYRLVGSFEEGVNEPVAVAGFRTVHNLAWGYFLYVDDLVTREAFRGRGHAGGLLQWIYEQAQQLGCQQVHLDSGVHRYDAHRLYLNQRMQITSHHFGRKL